MDKTFKVVTIGGGKKAKYPGFMDPDEALKGTVIAALETWALAADLVFVEAAPGNTTVDITFRVAPAKKRVDSPDMDVYASTNDMSKGRKEILIDGTQNWINNGAYLSPPVGIDLLTILIHEVGHALGLDHEVEKSTSIMFAEYLGIRHRLAPRDVSAICDLHGPVRSSFSIENPAGNPGPAKDSQFLAIGADQYLFFTEKASGTAPDRYLKAMRSRSLRVWERMELPELMGKDNKFTTHLHIAKFSMRLMVTRQSTRKAAQMAALPVSWYSPLFGETDFGDTRELGIRDSQAVMFDEAMLVAGRDGTHLVAYSVPKTAQLKFVRTYIDEFDFSKASRWAGPIAPDEQFKLLPTPDRAFVFKLRADGQLLCCFNETGDSWSGFKPLLDVPHMAVFDVVNFGDIIYLAFIRDVNATLASVVELRLDDSNDDQKLAHGAWFQDYQMLGKNWRSLSIVQQNARLTLVAENKDQLFFQEI